VADALTEWSNLHVHRHCFGCADVLKPFRKEVSNILEDYGQEAFGPTASPTEAARIVNQCSFGLSASIFAEDHFEALKLTKSVRVGAIHVNGAESTLLHGVMVIVGFARVCSDEVGNSQCLNKWTNWTQSY
jgi:hypothetical protein